MTAEDTLRRQRRGAATCSASKIGRAGGALGRQPDGRFHPPVGECLRGDREDRAHLTAAGADAEPRSNG